MKISAERLLEEIVKLGAGEIAEHLLLHCLDISHGQFCKHRKFLVERGILRVTHPNRKAYYSVAEI